ncbi:MAG: aminotransferase class V-fold PLP-dependent enzyme [Ruminococcus sp.]|nr:aminotransferase class V-fold PLP-dependent enzyme [Ruminococcus sp.]
MVNFDNAATTYPKPVSVREAAAEAIRLYGGNAGRGGHQLAMRTSRAVYSARETAADFFGAQPENTVFTLNCTHSLNLAIQGVMADGGHLIISSMEHNSAARPAFQLAAQEKITLSVARVYPDTERTVESFRRLMRPDTRAVVCTLASNVTGQLLPYREIAELCRERGICFIADGAQACGLIDVKLGDGINILCTAGHKGLYGISGTGLLVTDGAFRIKPIMQGGTGSASQSLEQPDFLPDMLESGTLNVTGAMTVRAGIEFVKKHGAEIIRRREEEICRSFISELGSSGVTVYRSPEAGYVPIVSFNIDGVQPERAAELLSEKGYCLRAGFHCAALAHATLGTENGTVRFAPSAFSRSEDAVMLARTIKKSLI